MEVSHKTDTFSLSLRAEYIGSDLLVIFSGGDQPHLGCTVLSVPRPSLTGNGENSATSSILNVTGHKDDILCRMVAEDICKKLGTTVVCTGGFHLDKIEPEQISEVLSCTKILSQKLLSILYPLS